MPDLRPRSTQPFPPSPLCAYCQTRETDGTRMDGKHACWTCIEDSIERENALAITPSLRETLPALFET